MLEKTQNGCVVMFLLLLCAALRSTAGDGACVGSSGTSYPTNSAGIAVYCRDMHHFALPRVGSSRHHSRADREERERERKRSRVADGGLFFRCHGDSEFKGQGSEFASNFVLAVPFSKEWSSSFPQEIRERSHGWERDPGHGRCLDPRTS